MLDTGFPQADAENDFLRARRRQVLATLACRLRRQPADSGRLLRLDQVIGALGMRGGRQLGLQTIQLATIVGTAEQRHDFDRHFRPTTNRVRERWAQLALAQRRGAAIPPIEVYRLGGLHFVSDGHHRVSIAAATGQQTIDAYVTEILTTNPPSRTTPRHASSPGGRRDHRVRRRRAVRMDRTLAVLRSFREPRLGANDARHQATSGHIQPESPHCLASSFWHKIFGLILVDRVQ